MNRYQLAKIIDWAGILRSRKRMQKLIFLLQAAGCPLDADYDFHKYGPYSQDVARLTDELTREGLLEEEVQRHPFGKQYCASTSRMALRCALMTSRTPRNWSISGRLTRGCVILIESWRVTSCSRSRLTDGSA